MSATTGKASPPSAVDLGRNRLGAFLVDVDAGHGRTGAARVKGGVPAVPGPFGAVAGTGHHRSLPAQSQINHVGPSIRFPFVACHRDQRRREAGRAAVSWPARGPDDSVASVVALHGGGIPLSRPRQRDGVAVDHVQTGHGVDMTAPFSLAARRAVVVSAATTKTTSWSSPMRLAASPPPKKRRRGAWRQRSEYEGVMNIEQLQGRTIVVTGVTGQVARPLAVALARNNEVYGAARFTDPAARQALEAAGVHCVPVDLASGDVAGLPADADYVLHFAVAKTNDWETDLAANSGGLAYLMEHHRGRGVPPLLDHRRVPARGPPRLRRGRPVG